MGEYAIRDDGQEVKIGTCEMMYYLRYEDRLKMDKTTNSLDPKTETGLFWRLPLPEEDDVKPGDYKDYCGAVIHLPYEFKLFDEGEEVEPGTVQVHTKCGLLANIKCYHGERLPEGSDSIKFFWNGKGRFYQLNYLKNHTDGKVWPVVTCRECGKMWRCEWSAILPFLKGEIKKRLEIYAF